MKYPTAIPTLLALMWIPLLAWAQTEPTSTPPPLPTEPIPEMTAENTTTNPTITATWIAAPKEYEWQVSFEWTTNLTEGVWQSYPIVVTVPFEKDAEFIRVNARKVEK